MKSSPLPRTLAACHRFLEGRHHDAAGRRRGFGAAASTVLAALVVAGCAPFHPEPPGKGIASCGSAMCRPGVGVSAFGNRCKVSVDIDPIRVPKGTVVTWTIAQIDKDPIIFLANGIAIDDPTRDFILPQLGVDGTTFQWTASEQGSSRNPLKYSVHAVWMKTGTDGILCQVLDPVIVNDF